VTTWDEREARLHALEARHRTMFECEACFALYGSQRAAEMCAEEDDKRASRD
jgi:hypothetical protein